VVTSPEGGTLDSPTRRLLGGLGHDVTRAMSPDHALELVNSDHTDLLVVDITNDANRELLDSISELPESKRPGAVLVFTDASDAKLREWQRTMAPTHVHVFVKPLHMHGLLNVLRRLENPGPAKLGA